MTEELTGGPYDISESDYRSDPGINISKLKNMRHTPAKARIRADISTAPSPEMELGTAIHKAILEPDRFFRNYQIKTGDRRTKAGKEAHEKALLEGKILISEEDFATCQTIAARIHEDPFFFQFIEKGIYESTWFYESDFRLKGRLDCWLPDKKVIVDIKTTKSAEEGSFIRDLLKYHYHAQAAFYIDLVEKIEGYAVFGYVILAIETTEDKDMRVFWLDQDLIKKGREDYESWLDLWKRCERLKSWPGYNRELVTLTLPNWMK